MEREELAAWLRVQLTPGVGNSTARRLLTAFGLPERIFDASAGALEQVASAQQSAALKRAPAEWQAQLDTTWQWLQANPLQHRVIALGDPAYPQSLLNMEDPPLLLYGMGAAEVWSHGGLATCMPRCLSVVGSRNPTPQGAANARQFSRSLAQAGLTIVSGLALGVDGAAHEGALEGAPEGQLATIAVVGTGLDRVYPKQHLDLAHRIAQRGLLLSEYPLGTPPLSANFPKRNRIIAGLSSGTLVVEAASIGLADYGAACVGARQGRVCDSGLHPFHTGARLPCLDQARGQAGGMRTGCTGRASARMCFASSGRTLRQLGIDTHRGFERQPA
jgi:DNA processing protein